MKTLLRYLFLVLLLPMLTACGGREGKTTKTMSTDFSSLSNKQLFLERYVNFRRSYEELEFDVFFIDGGNGLVPAPSEWDIRICAKVGEGDTDEWFSGMAVVESVDTDWVSSIPNAPANLDDFQWYEDNRKVVGVDLKNNIIVYRIYAF